MKQQELDEIARDIISNSIYMTLATHGEGPWAAPVYYCLGENYDFYYSSQMGALHTQHILKDPRVAFAIFDSRANEGQGNGVQGVGSVSLLTSDEELHQALRFYKSSFVPCSVSDFDSTKPYRLFRITTERLYVLDPDYPVDKRVQVLLP